VRRLTADDAGVTVEVQDNGPGVPPEQRSLIFEKFRQGGDAANRPQGTGLGLPISRQIVEHFGGRMWLRPDPVKVRASPSRYLGPHEPAPAGAAAATRRQDP
jgi:signal transduction histidine kinase